MKVIILAAGRGSRMGDKTNELPKGMTEIFGKPILEHCVETFEKVGFKRSDIAIVTGYKKEKIQFQDVQYFHNPDWAETNMFVSLTMAKEWLKSDDCIISYSDIIFDREVIQELKNKKGDIVLPYYTEFWELWTQRFENPLEDIETFKIENGKLSEIGQKPNSKDDIMGQYMGLLKFTPKGWSQIEEVIQLPMKKTIQKLDMTTLLQHLIEQNKEIEIFPSSKLWLECDNQNDVDFYEERYNAI